jgi:FkbM family methyltransferase
MTVASPPAGEDRLATVLRATGSFLARRRQPLLTRGYVQLLTRALPGREIQIVDRSGHRQVVDTRDQMGANALVGRYRLPPEIVAMVVPGDWVIDCGANIGIITSQLCAAVGPTGAVWACEPVPANVRRLELLRTANGLKQLTVIPSAIGAEPGSATIGLPPPGRSGWASITKSFGMADHATVAVETLDRLAAESPPGRRLRLVKIDVEGYEFEVLAGAVALLTSQAPAVYCEFNDVLLRDRGRSSEELLVQFADLGYHPVPGSAPLVARISGRVVNLLLRPETDGPLG